MNHIVRRLADQVDERTIKMLPVTGNLVLLGSADSLFLKSIRKKAEQFHINCIDFVKDPAGIVVDVETADVSENFMRDLQESPFDIDGPLMNGMTSVSEAIYMVLHDQNMIKGKNIAIVGRGHAVTGLAEMLIQMDATVLVTHSKTRDLGGALYGADVIVYATPALPPMMKPSVKDFVIDLGGVWKDNPYTDCPYVDRVGPLTVSLLLNRLAKVGGCLDA